MNETLKSGLQRLNGQRWLLAFVAVVSLFTGGLVSAAIGNHQYEKLRAEFEQERLLVRERLVNIEVMVKYLYEKEKTRED